MCNHRRQDEKDAAYREHLPKTHPSPVVVHPVCPRFSQICLQPEVLYLDVLAILLLLWFQQVLIAIVVDSFSTLCYLELVLTSDVCASEGLVVQWRRGEQIIGKGYILLVHRTMSGIHRSRR